MVRSLCVFSIGIHKQNAGSLLIAVSGTVIYVLSDGDIDFSFHGNFFSHFLFGHKISTANNNLQNNKRLISAAQTIAYFRVEI